MVSKQDKLRDNPLWKEGFELAEDMYSKLEYFGDYPEEKFNTESKLRNSVNDMIFYLSLAVGNISPGTSEYDWNSAHKNLFALQSMYIFASKQRFFELEPAVVVKIDKLLARLEDKVDIARKENRQREKEELEPWLEKYRLWKKTES